MALCALCPIAPSGLFLIAPISGFELEFHLISPSANVTDSIVLLQYEESRAAQMREFGDVGDENTENCRQ